MKKVYIEIGDEAYLINTDAVHFKTNTSAGLIYCCSSLSAKAGVDIIKVCINKYNFENKKQVMRSLFNTFINALNECEEILTIERSSKNLIIFKDGDKLLRTFDIDDRGSLRLNENCSLYDVI